MEVEGEIWSIGGLLLWEGVRLWCLRGVVVLAECSFVVFEGGLKTGLEGCLQGV